VDEILAEMDASGVDRVALLGKHIEPIPDSNRLVVATMQFYADRADREFERSSASDKGYSVKYRGGKRAFVHRRPLVAGRRPGLRLDDEHLCGTRNI
jgi:hypothetical protein